MTFFSRTLYPEFILKGLDEGQRVEFYRGLSGGRILGDGRFVEEVLASIEEEYSRYVTIEEIIKTVCSIYCIGKSELFVAGKRQPAAEARAMVALLVQESKSLTLTALGAYFQRDISVLSQSTGRFRQRIESDEVLRKKFENVEKRLGIPKCQA